MKSTGIVRKIDDLGRIVLPIELRRTLGIDVKDSLEIYVENGRILLEKYAPTCIFCGSDQELTQFAGKHICQDCIRRLQ